MRNNSNSRYSISGLILRFHQKKKSQLHVLHKVTALGCEPGNLFIPKSKLRGTMFPLSWMQKELMWMSVSTSITYLSDSWGCKSSGSSKRNLLNDSEMQITSQHCCAVTQQVGGFTQLLWSTAGFLRGLRQSLEVIIIYEMWWFYWLRREAN